MRESCIGCPAYNGSLCEVKKREERAVNKLGSVDDKKVLGETEKQMVKRIKNYSDNLYGIRKIAYDARLFFECHLNERVAIIISDEVQ